MKIIAKRITEHFTEHSRVFELREHPGSGICTPSDADGRIDWAYVLSHPGAARNVFQALNDPAKYVDMGVETYRHSYTRPAVGRCDCGLTVELSSFTNPCVCGADYNHSGQRLAPREHWGEETGEHWTECY